MNGDGDDDMHGPAFARTEQSPWSRCSVGAGGFDRQCIVDDEMQRTKLGQESRLNGSRACETWYRRVILAIALMLFLPSP